jgi:hypothetical protein
MRRSRHAGGLLLAPLAAAIALGGCSPFEDDSAQAIPARALPTLVLQSEDLDDGFLRFDEGALAIADSPVGERSDPARFGREGGWKSRYRRRGTAETPGPLVVESRVDLFDGSRGADDEFGFLRSELELQARHPADLQFSEVSELGDEAIALAPTRAGRRGSFAAVTVAWRHANVTASVIANGFGGRFGLNGVVRLARAQQRRIDAAETRGG